jgi:hypothetical protein
MEQDLDYTVLTFLENNGIKIGALICFFDLIKNDTHYVVTSNEENLHKVITISKYDHNSNMILGDDFYYNGYKFTISNSVTLANAEQMIKITDLDVQKYRQLHKCMFCGEKIADYSKVKHLFLSSLRTLSVLPNCQIVELIYVWENSNKIDIPYMFPNLKKIGDCTGKIVYQRK